jgi:hypothetical protein
MSIGGAKHIEWDTTSIEKENTFASTSSLSPISRKSAIVLLDPEVP